MFGSKFFEFLADLTIRHRGRVLTAAAVLVVLASWGAARVRFNPELLAFLPEHNDEVRKFRRVVDTVGAIDRHVVVVKVPAGTDPEEVTPLIEELAGSYRSLPVVTRVEYRAPTFTFFENLIGKAALLLEPDEVSRLKEKLSASAIAESMEQNRLLLSTPQSTLTKRVVQSDPLRLHTIVAPRLRTAYGAAIDLSTGYILSEDRSTFVLIVTPSRPAHELPFARQLMRHAKAIEQAARGSGIAAEIVYAGAYAITAEDADLIRDDMLENVAFSFFGVLALFLYAFRRLSAIGYAAIPMGLAILLTFGLASITVDELNAASAGFAALLAGLGIDFITVLYERYVEERGRGQRVAESVYAMVTSTMPGVALAGFTTAATFYGFLFTDFRGMTQMGFLTGTGILLFLLSAAFVLPSLLVAREKDSAVPPRVPFHVFGTSRVMRFSMQHPRAVLFFWAAFMIVMPLLALRLEFDDDVAALRPAGNRGVAAQEYLAARFGRSFDFVMLVAEGTSVDAVMRRSEEALPLLDALVRRGTIGGYQSLSAVVPSEARQRDVIEQIREIDAAAVTADLSRAAIASGFRAGAFDSFAANLKKALAVREPLSPIDIDEDLTARFLQRTEKGWLAVTYLYPRERWARRVAPELKALEGEGLFLTGVNVVSSALREIARADAIRATLIGTGIVFVLLSIGFRSAGRAALVFIPFVAGSAGMLGLMAILGLAFNFINMFVGLMLAGVGTDYGVYILQRYLESPDDFRNTVPLTGKAVVMAALTTIVGYGSFMLSRYPGLQSLGYAATAGVGLSALAAISLLPAILSAFGQKRTSAPVVQRSK